MFLLVRAAKGSGDPGWDHRVSFSRSDTSLRVGGVLDCKGARRNRTVGHVRVPIWEMRKAGQRVSKSAGQRKGGKERFVLSHPSAQNAEGCGIHGFPIRRVGHPHILL